MYKRQLPLRLLAVPVLVDPVATIFPRTKPTAAAVVAAVLNPILVPVPVVAGRA